MFRSSHQIDSPSAHHLRRSQHEKWKVLIRIEISQWPLAGQKNTILSQNKLYFILKTKRASQISFHNNEKSLLWFEMVFFCPASGHWEFSTLMRTFHFYVEIFSDDEPKASQSEKIETWKVERPNQELKIRNDTSWIGT